MLGEIFASTSEFVFLNIFKVLKRMNNYVPDGGYK